MSLHNFNSNTKSWKMYTNTLTSVSGDDLLVMPSYGKDIILEVSANNDIFFKKGTITKRFDNLVSDYLETSFNSLNSRVEYILQEISGASVKDFITSGISNDLLIKSYDGRDIILEVSGNNEIIFKRGDFSYNLDDLIGGGGSNQSSDYATYNILDITGKIIFTDNSGTSGTSGSGGSSNIVLTSISGNIIPSINNTFKLGDISKNWSNAYIRDISVTNINGQPYINNATYLIDYSNSSFSPLGQDLSGEASNGQATINYFGYSVALSQDGRIMGVTAPLNNGTGTFQGSSRIYKYNDVSWVQLGQDIDGIEDGRYQAIINLSSDGTIAAISSHYNLDGRGRVRIFKYTNDTSWVQLGLDISGEAANAVNGNEEFGFSISLSGNGKIIAIGAPKNDTSYNEAGQVRVYSYIENTNSWNIIGTFNGFGFDNKSGRSVSLSSSGTILAISSPFLNNNNNLSLMPRVDIYEFSNNVWSPKGPTIYGSYLGKDSKFGNNIVLSKDGLILAINELYNPSNNNLGRVLTYKYNSTDNSWNKLGSIINIAIDSNNLDWEDPYIALSSDGTIMALGMAGTDYTNRGLVRLYKLINSEWIKIGPDILGNASEGLFGFGLSLSSDGSIVAIGSPQEGSSSEGYVRVYKVNYSYNSVIQYYQFTNVKANNIDVTNIEISGNIVGNIIPLNANSSSLGSSLKPWSNAYIRDVSVTNIDVSGNLNPLIANSSSLGSSLKHWSNAYIRDISVSNISVSENIILNICGGTITNINKLTAPASNYKITSTTRLYQEISGDISWNAVNGYYGLAKDAYPGLNPYSSGAKAVSNWTGRSLGVELNSWRTVCWSPELRIFVAVTNNGDNRVMTSTNGTSWTNISDGVGSNQWSSVCWSAELGIFVAVSYGNVMISATGTSWTSISDGILNGEESNSWTSVCWSAELGIFVAVAFGRVMTSANGTSWTSISDGVQGNNWASVCWSAELGIFVAVAYNGVNRIMTSANGTSWTSTSDGVEGNNWASVCWSAELGIFVAVAYNGVNRIMTSANGTSWTSTSDGVDLNAWNSVCWSAELGIFVAVARGGDNRVMYSANGTSWTSTSDGVELNVWNSVCWSAELGIFVAVAIFGEESDTRVMTSSLKGRPPTSYNVFDSTSNSIDENGTWTFSNISIVDNLVPVNDNYSNLGLDTNKWASAHIASLNTNSIGIVDNLVPVNDNYSNLGLDTNRWASAHIASLNTNSISIVDNIVPVADVYSNLGLETNKWNNAHIYSLNTNYLNTGSISIVDNLVPVNDLYSNLGLETNRWNNAYINALNVTETVTFGGSNLYVPSSFTIDPIGHGDNTGTVFINGNLVVQGVTTTINSSVLDISDKMIVFASKASNSLQADGAGFEISGAKVNFLYNNSSATFRSSIGISISGNVVPVTSTGSLGEAGKIWDIAYIRELNVTNFTNSIDGAKIASGTITTTQIANNTIMNSDISNSAAIAFSKINTANAIMNSDISNSAAIAFSKINASLAITDSHISASAAISGSKIANTSITATQIANTTITAAQIANTTITGTQIANTSITSDKINQANNWTFSQLTSTTANIRDISTTNIEVSGNIVPLRDMSSNLGSSLKRWNNVFVNDLSVNTINGAAYSAGGGGTVSNSVSYLYSDEFTLYSPEATNSRAMEIITPGSRFKRNYYLVPFNAKIESVIVEQIGETTPVTYLIDIWVNNSRSSTDVPRFLLTKNNVTSITLSNTNNSSTLNYSQQIAYYISAVPTANLIMYYPFSYNTQNVADRTTFKSAISDIEYTDDAASIKVGVASAVFGPKMSFTTEREIPFCGTGTENIGVTANSNGYTLITFWLNPRIVNSGDVQIMSSGYYMSPSNFINKGWYMSLKGAEGVSYQDDTTVDGEGQTNLFGLYFYCLARAGTQDSAGIYNGNHEVYVTGPNTLPSYTWTHIALYITPYNVFLCYNGVMVARSAYGATAPYYYYVQIPNSRMMIHSGMRSTGYSRSENEMWNGYISDLRVYNTTTDFMGADALGTTTGVTMSYLTPFQTANISSTKYLATNSGILVADTTSFTETYVPDSGKIFVSIKETGANVSNLDERVSVRLLLSPAIRTGYYGTINIITVGGLYYTMATGSWSSSSSGWYYSGSNIARTLPITDRLATPGSIFYIIADADTQNYIYNISGTDCTVTATYVLGWGTPIRASVVFNSTLVPGTTTSITIKARSVSIPLSTP